MLLNGHFYELSWERKPCSDAGVRVYFGCAIIHVVVFMVLMEVVLLTEINHLNFFFQCDVQKVKDHNKMDKYVTHCGYSAWFETSAKYNLHTDDVFQCLISQVSQYFNVGGTNILICIFFSSVHIQ
jgi:hypothetical protein